MNSSGRQLRASQYNCTRTQSVDSTRSPGAWDDRNLRQGRIRARKDLERDQFIRLVPLFSSMPTHLLHLCASHLKLKTYSKGRTIVQEGDFSDTLHIIADGVVQLMTGSSTVDLMGKDSFGEHNKVDWERINSFMGVLVEQSADNYEITFSVPQNSALTCHQEGKGHGPSLTYFQAFA